ncbi:MAG: hypothetical protein ACJ70X_02575 [Nitrososphaera sp.]
MIQDKFEPVSAPWKDSHRKWEGGRRHGFYYYWFTFVKALDEDDYSQIG